MRLLIATLPLLLAGCAVSPEQCARTDWRQQGLEDGFDGLVARSGYWQSQCKGVTVDPGNYSRGWAEGNRQYCTAEQGYRQGRLGNDYQGVCQGSAKDAFMGGYEKGRRQYQQDQYRQSLYDRQRDIRWRIGEIDDRLRDGKLGHREREQLRWERQQLTQELMQIDSMLLHLL
ncbi:DUF2799 domain-containing protein [Gallaecimonas kandeliae]|uniref:DUF2799 domain-containing protein n=1 Tax=Gallaecimonas kandeliae TaxID=3029055 RepID=UPI00264803D2|nr:DUF2799 domain-containing protein [Gallaecimonas kandeliae]WKE65594.1 DUF2799 domain-containing protein [Gallaecimonas kandeliae]